MHTINVNREMNKRMHTTWRIGIGAALVIVSMAYERVRGERRTRSCGSASARVRRDVGGAVTEVVEAIEALTSAVTWGATGITVALWLVAARAR